MYMPVKELAAGAVPILFISMPATWLPIMLPPMLAQLMPFTKDVFAVDVVEVVMITEALSPAEPIRFPSPATLPPIFIPPPFVSMPINATALADVGTEEIANEATIFPLIFETGEALVVVNDIP